MAAGENTIGQCRCPVCGSGRAALRVSAKQLAYIVCNSCNVQVFGRSDRSDELIRAMRVDDDPAPADPPVPAATPALPELKREEQPEPAAPGWGVWRG